jgi:hypothetical protein
MKARRRLSCQWLRQWLSRVVTSPGLRRILGSAVKYTILLLLILSVYAALECYRATRWQTLAMGVLLGLWIARIVSDGASSA